MENFTKLLLTWYKKNKRKLLWRQTKDPYKILVVEILLQRTDYKKIKKIYPIFIQKYPTIFNLYQAEDEDISELFNKIGLVSRAIRLKKIGNDIIYKYKGKIPNNKNDLISLCGVGNYISNAVLCFAYNKRVPIVDSNIIRLYGRVFNLKSLKSRPHTDKKIWDFAQKILPSFNYIEYNYALLDFSSKICKYKKPKCKMCVVSNICKYNITSASFNEDKSWGKIGR